MKMFTVLALVLVLATSALALEKKAFQMRQDFGAEPLAPWTCALQYYYFIPCPTMSWFWAWSGWIPGDIIGAWFTVGESPTDTLGAPPGIPMWPCAPCAEHALDHGREHGIS